MDLAFDAGISPRHLSFIETGRSRPSREVVARLAAALGLPFRHRNALFLAAGFAPEFTTAALDDPLLSPVRHALERHLSKHEPYPAVVVSPAYDILMSNEGYRRAVTLVAGPEALVRHPNVYRLTFAADGLRPYILGWPVVRAGLLARLRGEALLSGDPATAALLRELEHVDADAAIDGADPSNGLPVLTLQLRAGSQVLSFFSTITSFGTPLDVTVQELRLECLFPADETTQWVLESAGAS
jgi:transcriptional regulator with XRE-family HTH domain